MSIDSIKPAAQSTQRTSGGASVTEYIVPPAMLVVAVAAGLACNMHVGFAPELAAAIGLTLFCIDRKSVV